MSKSTKRKPSQPKGETIADRERREARQQLQRSLRQERQIRTLARQLTRAIWASDRALREFAQFIVERDGDAALHSSVADRKGNAAPAT